MSNLTINQSAALGAGIGLSISAVMFFTVPWYHSMIVWSWSNPWLLGAGFVVGVITAIADK